MLATIQHLIAREAYRPQDFFVLARIRASLASIEEKLVFANIPAVSKGGSYWDNKLVNEVLELVRFGIDEAIDDATYSTVFDIPILTGWSGTTRKLGAKYLDDLTALFQQGVGSIWDAMLTSKPHQTPYRRKGVDDIIEMRRILYDRARQYSLPDYLNTVVSGYSKYYMRRYGPEGEEALEVLDPLLRFASDAKSWDGLLALKTRMLSASISAKAKEEAVVLSTIHGVKGLERPVVFGIGLSEGVLPHWLVTGDEVLIAGVERSREDLPPSSYDGDIEDERCAAYVMCTRAQERLYLSGAWQIGGKTELRPSRFLDELAGREIEREVN